MRMLCERIFIDPELKAHGVEAYVLTDTATNDLEIESGALIEKRNREKFGVLVAFIPQGLRLPAEDSYDIQTFKTYDLGNVLRAHARQMLKQLPDTGQEVAKHVLGQATIRRVPVDQQIKYLLALKNDGSGWEEAGAYLFHLDLIPDLDLAEKTVETRLDRNSKCVAALTDESQSTLSALETLSEKIQLEPQENNLRENLISFLRVRNVAETGGWLREILADSEIRSKLNFAKWKFKDSPDAGTVEVHLNALRDPKTGAVVEGFRDEAGNLIASTSSPIKLKWKTYPSNAPNLAHFVVLVVRDSDDDGGSELLRKTTKNNRRTETRAKISLKEIELAEGETCAAKVIVQARDISGVVLSSDESEPFWIEGGEQSDDIGKKKVNKVRNRAEAFFLSAHRSRKILEIDSEGWEEGRRPLLYRLKLKNRDIYHIAINPVLHAIELRNISDPMTCGAWEGDLCNRGNLEETDLKHVPVSIQHSAAFNEFSQARKDLFDKFQQKDPNGVVEILDLREFKAEVIHYAQAYVAVLNEIRVKLQSAGTDGQINNVLNASHQFNRLDTIHVKIGDSDGIDQLVLLAPTHPIRVLWLLQYQQLLFSWAERLNGVSEAEAAEMVSREAHERITSLNIPPALAFKNGDIYINSDNMDLYWSILPKGTTSDVRKAVSTLQRLLGYKLNQGEITVITAAQVADRIWRYLKHHPYVTTLRIDVVNPGDGLLVLNAIREIQKLEEFKELNYDVAFYADQRYEIMGSAFDEMTEGTTLSEGSQPDIDEELLRPNTNPLFPKLTFSKRKVTTDWKNTDLREAHITILVDRFSTKVLTRQTQPPPGSFCLHNLLAEYRADFDVKGDSATWSRKVVPSQNTELSPSDCCAQVLFEAVDCLTRLASCFYDWGNSLDRVPAIQLELSDTDKHLVNHIHEHSDWVFTIDRNFGIEYFDNPRSGGGAVRSYLIDYSPEFLDGIGHRLIISTFWLSEIEGIISDGLKKMGIPGTGFQAAQILDVLKSVSGRLALKLINNPKDAKEIIGLALTRLLLQDNGDLETGVLIPVDSHIDLFAEHKRTSDDSSIRLQRSDLILVRAKDGNLVFRLIEVKYRSNAGGIGEDVILKEAIAGKNDDTQKVFETRFVPKVNNDRLDRELQSKELANLVHFYVERGRRHGLLMDSGAVALSNALRKIQDGSFNVAFEKAGYIYHTQGLSKSMEIYKANEIFIVGHERILELLGMEEDLSAMPAAAPPQATAAPPASIAGSVAPIKIHDVPAQSVPKESETSALPSTTASDTTITSELVAAATKSQLSSAHYELRLPVGKNTDTGKPVYWDR